MTIPRVPTVSVVITTYNRAGLLGDAIRSVLNQRNVSKFELVVVDNNSSDSTRSVVEALIPDAPHALRYLFEPKQGASHGRNAGVNSTSSDIIAFTDDDVRADPTWLSSILTVFNEHPQAAFVGGKVLPLWPGPVPVWLDRNHWSPLALVDYGDEPFTVDLHRPICLVSANLAVRRDALDSVGGFHPYFQHINGAVSAIEDQELQLRMIRGGECGVYSPTILMHAEVQPHRLEKAYHRKWHFQHGWVRPRLLGRGEAFNSSMIPEAGVRSRTLLGIPLWAFRQLGKSVKETAFFALSGNRHQAFVEECNCFEFAGLIKGFFDRSRH